MAAENLSPLSPQEKKNFLTYFDKIEGENLTNALVEAALCMQTFPPSLREEVEPLQKSYEQHHKNKHVEPHLKKSIVAYFTSEGSEKFRQAALLHDFNEQEWKSGFLFFLARKLKLNIEQTPVVEAKIKKNGKVAWRTIDPNTGKPLTEFPRSQRSYKFKYNKAKCWRMTFENFRKFKDSGKRGGNQSITLERFLEYFEDYNQSQVTAVWNELHDIGILNRNDRLTASWRALSNEKIALEAITDPDVAMTKDKIVEYLKELGVNEKLREKREPVDRDDFIAQWQDDQHEDAGAIWDLLQEEGILDDDNKPTYKIPQECVTFITRRQLTYSKISKSLHEIANEEHGVGHFRPERTRKNWAETSLITNNTLDTDEHSTKKYDIDIYKKLNAHAQTGDGFDHDHNPSACILDHFKSTLQTQLKAEIEACRAKHKDCEDKKDLLNTIEKENKDNWWTMAIPGLMHKRGLTCGMDKAQQLETLTNPFHDETEHYLKQSKLEEHHLEEIGAFRNLYRAQSKEHQSIGDHAPIGKIPFLFFQSKPELCAKISGQLNTGVKKHIKQAEDLSPSKARKALFK